MSAKKWIPLVIVACMAAVMVSPPVSGSATMPPQSYTGKLSDPLLAGLRGGKFDDLAIGVPYESENLVTAGAVHVVFGSIYGVTPYNSLFFDEGFGGVNTADGNDIFGEALAIGDFNGDGHFDLAVGIHNKTVNTIHEAGMVQIFYGDDNGLVQYRRSDLVQIYLPYRWDCKVWGSFRLSPGDRRHIMGTGAMTWQSECPMMTSMGYQMPAQSRSSTAPRAG